jgi:glycosyltransferase involved in cell wall biosynthesis
MAIIKKRIIHILTDKNIGGAGRWLLNCLKFHNEALYDVMVVLPSDSLLKEPLKKIKFSGIIDIYDMDEKSLSFNDIAKFKKIFKDFNPDIVHTHASLSARIAAKLSGVRYVINTKHCLENTTNNTIKKFLNRLINKMFSDKIIAVSKAVEASMLETNIDEKQIVTIYNGIELSTRLSIEEINSVKADYGIKSEDSVVGIAARLEPVKDISTFIKAAKEIVENRSKSNKPVKFIIAGSGSLESQLKAQVNALGLDNEVVFTGFVKDIEKLMSIFDINVISSIQEALCISIIEGMGMGIPAVGTDSGGVNEVILDGITGSIVKCGDYEALANRITDILDNKSLYELYSKNSMEHIKNKFLAEEMTRKIEQLYTLK